MIPSSRHPETASERSIRLVEEFVAGWNAHDAAWVAALHAPDFEGVDIGRPEVYRGSEGAARLVGEVLETFPDLVFTREESLVEGNLIAFAWTARGTHKGGNLMRIPPTGREISVRGVSMLTVGDEGITHALYVWDTAGLLRDIGLLPML